MNAQTDRRETNAPSTKVTSLTNGHTTKVSADTKHDKPLWPLRPALVTLGVPQGLPVRVLRLLNLIRCTMSDEHGLATPFDDNVLSLRDASQLDFDLGQSKDISGRSHCTEELGDGRLCSGCGQNTEGADHEVRQTAVSRLGLGLVTREVGDLGSILGYGGGVYETLLENARRLGCSCGNRTSN